MIDFSALELATEKPFRLFLIHPVTRNPMVDPEGNPAYVDHYSADSEIAQKHQRSVLRNRLSTQRGRWKLTPEEIEADAVGGLAALTAGWHLVDLQGELFDVPFTMENARKLYAIPAAKWLREQLDESVGDRANFARGSSAS